MGKVLVFVVAVGAFCLYLANRTVAQTSRGAQTEAVVEATRSFLDSLSPAQREKVQFPFTAQKTATLARFARSGGAGGPAGGGRPGDRGGGDKQAGRGPDDGGAPGGSRGRRPGMGPGGGFVGEKYGEAVWSNYPVSDVPRPGLQLGSLSESQRTAAMHLLQVVLSPMGYQK